VVPADSLRLGTVSRTCQQGFARPGQGAIRDGRKHTGSTRADFVLPSILVPIVSRGIMSVMYTQRTSTPVETR
jgi:hypothetical protein